MGFEGPPGAMGVGLLSPGSRTCSSQDNKGRVPFLLGVRTRSLEALLYHPGHFLFLRW